MVGESILWRRLDLPGHDACRLERMRGGWRLDGAAVFRDEGVPACLGYELECDGAWRTRRGGVRGWLGNRAVDVSICSSDDGVWTLDGVVVEGLDGCVDLDLGFTPATNLFQLRRIALGEGHAADVPVAWLDVSGGTLDTLQQRYERRTATTYRYEAPRFAYAASLEVAPSGFVLRYPGLWEIDG